MKTNPRKALIIGGRVAGPVVAMALKRAGIASVVYEAREPSGEEAGASLGLAPNGVNALKTLDIAHRLKADGFSTRGIIFFNGNSKRIGELDSSAEEQRYGSQNIIIKRGQLHRALNEEALRQDIRIEEIGPLPAPRAVKRRGKPVGAGLKPAPTPINRGCAFRRRV
jgi:2-polyprenyl-6-methoxyphenol hydroxylase-like FAD-dependent oxidoreductase